MTVTTLNHVYKAQSECQSAPKPIDNNRIGLRRMSPFRARQLVTYLTNMVTKVRAFRV
jgi:hypothetical protein